jgi:hypothetical protein
MGGSVSWEIFWFENFDLCDNYYPTNSWWTTIAVFYLSFIYFFFSDVISFSLLFWRNSIGSRSLWSVLGGGGRESPVKHEMRGASRGGPAWARKDRAGESTGREGPGEVGSTGEERPGGRAKKDQARWGARAKKDRAGERRKTRRGGEHGRRKTGRGETRHVYSAPGSH